MPDICTFLTHILGGAISAAMGGFIGYWSAIRISRLNARSAASAKFRAAFAPAQAKLSMPGEIGNIGIRKYFDESFLSHAAAIEEFRPFARDGIAYQEACDKYREALFANDAIGDARLRWDSGMMVNEHGNDTLDFLDVIGQRINTILSHA